MKKITFKNLPDKTTPISANNLNQLQNNIEEAILNPVVESIKSKNLVNEIITGYTLTGTGGIKVDATQFVTDFMEVEAEKTYTSQGFKGANGAENNYKDWYTADKTFISNTNDKTATAPANAKFCRMNGVISTSSDMQFEEGSTATSYTPFKKYGYNSRESMGSIVVDDIRSKNLVNRIIYGYELGNRGATNVNQNWLITDYIPVAPGETYTQSGFSSNYAEFTNANKEYVSDSHDKTFQVPNGACYVRLNGTIATSSNMQLELGSTATNYSEYKDFDNIGSWVDIALANTYSFLDLDAYNGLQYKKIGNQVFLRGMLVNSVANPVGYYATCGFLPEECRPKKPVYLICNQEGGPCNCTVETDGGIRVYNTKANSWIALDAMRFFID